MTTDAWDDDVYCSQCNESLLGNFIKTIELVQD